MTSQPVEGTHTDGPQALSFSAFITENADGVLEDRATAELRDLVQAVLAQQKKGTLVVELTVNPAGGSGRMVRIAGNVTAKPPKAVPEESLFYATRDGGLTKDDPFQPSMFEAPPASPTDGTVVAPPPGVNASTGEVAHELPPPPAPTA